MKPLHGLDMTKNLIGSNSLYSKQHKQPGPGQERIDTYGQTFIACQLEEDNKQIIICPYLQVAG